MIIRDNAAKKFTLNRIAKPSYAHGDGTYHYVLAQVDGDRISLEVMAMRLAKQQRLEG